MTFTHLFLQGGSSMVFRDPPWFCFSILGKTRSWIQIHALVNDCSIRKLDPSRIMRWYYLFSILVLIIHYIYLTLLIMAWSRHSFNCITKVLMCAKQGVPIAYAFMICIPKLAKLFKCLDTRAKLTWGYLISRYNMNWISDRPLLLGRLTAVSSNINSSRKMKCNQQTLVANIGIFGTKKHHDVAELLC